MELETLEIIFDANIERVEEKMAPFISSMEKAMGKLSSITNKGTESVEKDLSSNTGFEKMNKNLEKLTSSVEKNFSKMEQAASDSGKKTGSALSSGVSKGVSKMSQDVQSQIDKVNIKMQQARAAQQKISNLQSDRNGAAWSGDGKAASRIDEKIASAQIQMNKAQGDAQAIVRKMKAEYDAIPSSIKRGEQQMQQNEAQIERMRTKVKSLQDLMKQQQIEKGSFGKKGWQTSGYEDTKSSTKTSGEISKLETRMQKLIAENDKLMQQLGSMDDRSGMLKKALAGLNTELGQTATKSAMASNGMRNLSGQSKTSQGLFGRLKGMFSSVGNTFKSGIGRMGSIFSNQSNQVTNGTSRMSKGMRGFGMSMKMLWSQLFLFTFLYQGIMTLVGGLWKALQTNTQFSASLNQIKVNLLTAFYPIYQAILPALNALMSGLAKVTGYIAGFVSALFGVKIGDAFSGAQGLMDNVQAMEDNSSAAADVDDGYDDMAESIKQSNEQMKKQHAASEKARKAAAKLKQMLMGFDEINTLDFDDGMDDYEPEEFIPQEIPDRPKSPSGGGGAPWADFGNATVPETPKWLTDFAKKFKDIMSKLFDPIKKAWDAQGQRVMDAFKYSLSEIGKLIGAIGKSFMEVWTNGTGQKFVENLLILLGDVLYIIGDIARAFRIAWEENGRGTKLIQQIFDALNQWLEVLHDIAESFRNVWNNGTGIEVARQLIEMYTNIFHLLETVGKAFQNAWNDNGRGTALIQSIFNALIEVLKLINSITTAFDKAFASGIGESILANIMDIIKNIFNTVGNLAKSFRTAWDENSRGQKIFEGIMKILDTILGTINRMTGATAEWAKKLDFRPLLDSINGLLKAIQPLTKNIGDGLEWFYKNVLLPLASYTIQDLIPAFLNALSGAVTLLSGIIDGFKPAFDFLWNSVLKPIAEWTGGIIVEVLKKIGDALTIVGNWISEHSEGFSNFVLIVGSFATALGLVNAAVLIWNTVAAIATAVSSALAAAIAFLTSPIGIAVAIIGSLIAVGVLLYKNWDTIKEKAGQLASWIGEKWEGIKTATSNAWESVKKWTSEKWEAAKNAVTTKASEIYNSTKEKFTGVVNTVSEKMSSAATTIQTKAGQAKDWATTKWSELRSNTASKFEEVRSTASSKMSSAAEAVRSGAESARTKAVSAFSNLKDGVSGKLNEVKNTASDVFGKIGSWASELPGKIADGLRNGVYAIGNAISGIANSMVRPIGNAVNSIIGGINWVLGSVNAGWSLNTWDIPYYAKGTNYHPGGPALVNDAPGSQYQEMFKLPDGRMGMFPKQRNMLVDLPRGAQVMPGNMIPNYAGGIFGTFKDFFSNGFDRAKGIASDVWNVISNPSALVEEAMSKFVNLSGLDNPAWSIVDGFLSYAKNAVVNMVVDMINSFTGFENGGLISKHGFFEGSEGDKPEMILPLTKPARALELMNDAFDFMGMDGVPELTMPEVFRPTQPSSLSIGGGSRGGSLESFRGNDLSELGNQMASQIGNKVTEAILQLVNMLGASNGIGSGDEDSTLEVILQVDSTRLGEVSVKGINKYHKKTGQIELII
ncbi:hypothetical protein JZO81_19420 [Enterococcus hulanensis]|uniref:hypothetical protein n=1 Tax=Enterococcus TaxID=1350 RepID=UPI000B5AABEC|nr:MULTISPECIES: hypothetical protein [Enterococcus]MBO0413231.1 hypothetical protein [Enterococcus hulanensis]OTO15102.1 hypothetical protein A5875_004259 [Enterococcus sp. 3H8_DIV0648]